MADTGFYPFPEISTPRLLLRRLTLKDAPEILFLRSDDNVMQFIEKEKTITIEEAEAFIQRIIDMYEARESLMWAICLQNQPEKLIGNICIWRIQKEHFRAEVGYTLHPSHWRKGIMKESLQLIINHGFKNIQLHSLEARINPDNLASAALLENTGFTREAYFKEDYCFRGKFNDTAVYSLLAPK